MASQAIFPLSIITQTDKSSFGFSYHICLFQEYRGSVINDLDRLDHDLLRPAGTTASKQEVKSKANTTDAWKAL
jgi:hypothetical protein